MRRRGQVGHRVLLSVCVVNCIHTKQGSKKSRSMQNLCFFSSEPIQSQNGLVQQSRMTTNTTMIIIIIMACLYSAASLCFFIVDVVGFIFFSSFISFSECMLPMTRSSDSRQHNIYPGNLFIFSIFFHLLILVFMRIFLSLYNVF